MSDPGTCIVVGIETPEVDVDLMTPIQSEVAAMLQTGIDIEF